MRTAADRVAAAEGWRACCALAGDVLRRCLTSSQQSAVNIILRFLQADIQVGHWVAATRGSCKLTTASNLSLGEKVIYC